MLTGLPDEVLQRILDYAIAESPPRSAVALSLVSRRFALAVHLRNVRLSSGNAAFKFEQVIAANPDATRRVKTLVLEAERKRTRESPPTRRQRRGDVKPAELDADAIVRLCAHLSQIGTLVLRELDLSTLRRRQLGFAARLSHLHSLVLSSPPSDSGDSDPARRLNVYTLGRILQDSPQLEHLGVRGLRGSPSALRGLTPPVCRLVSCGIFSTSGVTGVHLGWILSATTASDSLRTVAFDLDESTRPAQLSAVKWALLPVRHVYVTSRNTRAIAALPQHFPSIRTDLIRINASRSCLGIAKQQGQHSTMLSSLINIPKWLEENGHLLAPPVGNKCIYDGGDFTVMLVGGPNSRNDYHLNETEEWFYQYKGKMTLKVIEDATVGQRVTTKEGLEAVSVEGGHFREITIGEGEMFLLPGNTPHNPCRYADTVGIVVERVRPPTAVDRLRWYCQNPEHASPTIIREKSFHCTDLGSQLKPIITEWMSNPKLRVCPDCGQQAEAK